MIKRIPILLALGGLSSCININQPANLDPAGYPAETPVAPAPTPPPPAPEPAPAPPPGTPSSPSRPVGVAPSAPEFHLQIFVQESIPAAKGLGRTLHYPQPGSDLPIYTGKVGIVYEWRPKDGLEDRINSKTGKVWGPIWKETVAEQMVPENLQRHLDTVEQWVATYVPRDFEGVVSLDVERWPLKSDSFHLTRPARDELAKYAPGKTQAELMARFMRLTEERVKQVRPRVKAWGWWAMGGLHPGFITWHADLYKAWRDGGYVADRDAVAGTSVPFPNYYFPSTYPDAATRKLIWPKMNENWVLMYGAERLARDGYAYLNIRHPGTANKPFADQPLTREQFHECVEAAWAVGIRRFVIWDVVDGPRTRDIDQKFIDEILMPEARAWADRSRAERARR